MIDGVIRAVFSYMKITPEQARQEFETARSQALELYEAGMRADARLADLDARFTRIEKALGIKSAEVVPMERKTPHAAPNQTD